MQLFSIENLCLAAEATAVLLVLAFAWPEKQTAVENDETESDQTDWEPAKSFCLQACIYRGLYVQQCRQNSSLSDPFVLKDCDTEDWKPPLPTPWQDRLTKCLNRIGLDSILKGWLEIEVKHREGSCISMLTLNDYAEMVSAHGAMVTEQALQAIASQLSNLLSKDCIVARYLPDRFVILHLGSRLPDCRKTMGALQGRITDPTFFSIGGEPLSIACIVSMASIDSHTDIAVSLEELDEGTVEAERTARNILAKLDGHWVEVVGCEPTLEESKTPINVQDNLKPTTTSTTAATNATATAAAATTATTATTATPAIIAETDAARNAASTEPLLDPKVASASTTGSSESQVEKPAQSSNSESASADAESTNDISAVANSDDIAALFAQINSNKSAASAAPPKASPPATPAIVAEANSTDVASPDDIAALFHSVKAKGTSSSAPSVPTPSNPISNAPATDAQTIADIGLDQAASKDDIASLFSSVKTAVRKPATETPSAPVAAEEQDLVATQDDIAALFSSIKSAVKTEPTAAPAKAPQPPMASERLVEIASVDDIAMLFETVKNAEAVSEQKAALVEVETSTEELSASASLDDIEALFASIKK